MNNAYAIGYCANVFMSCFGVLMVLQFNTITSYVLGVFLLTIGVLKFRD